MGPMRILVVEDDAAIASLIRRGLEDAGFGVGLAGDGPSGEALALSGDFDLVLLDILLPGKNGREVLSAIRERRPGLPVILLTALGDVEDRVEGLELGADDYVSKPFAFEELLARVRATLRRPGQRDEMRLIAGDIELDFRTRRVTRAGTEVTLTAREFDLLAYLMRHPGQVLERDRLLSAVWGMDFDPGTNVLDVYVGYLRRKLGTEGSPAPIETVRSVGYRFASGDA